MAELEGVFEACVAQMQSGASLQTCLAGHPAEASELAPLLRVVAGLQALSEAAPSPDPAASQAARSLFLERAAALSQPPTHSVEDALEASLGMIAEGATIEECLQAFPHYARELRSALAITGAMRSGLALPVPARPSQAVASQRQAFLASASTARRSRSGQEQSVSWLQALISLVRQPAWAMAAVMLVVLLLSLGFGRAAVTMASDALPGDVLYSVKLAAEQARLLVTVDQEQRVLLREQFDQNRREEAAAVVEQGRAAQVQFRGEITSMVDGVWSIAGLEPPLLVPGSAVVRGLPAVGKDALVLAYADRGALVARQVIVFALADEAPPTPTRTPTRTLRPTPTSAPAGLPASPLPTPTYTRTPLPAPPPATPSWTPVFSPTLTLTATNTPTLTPSPSGTPTLTASPTATEPIVPRPESISGRIQEKHPAWWLIEGQRVGITMNTRIDESLGPAVVGADILGEALRLTDDSLVAVWIQVQRSPVDRDFFTGVIMQMGGSQWLIGNRWVQVTGSTEIVGNPAVGKVARVSAERTGNGPWTATRIEVEEPPEPVYIEGVISAIGGSSWVVDGQTVQVDGNTVISGVTPRVGLYAEVEAIPRGGGLYARYINVVAPTITPTWTPTVEPPTATPTGTPTVEPPTATPTGTPSTPTATPTGEPMTPTPTESPPPTTGPPTATPTPEPSPPTPTPTSGLPEPPPPTATPAPPTATPVSTPTPVPTNPVPVPTFPFTPPPFP